MQLTYVYVSLDQIVVVLSWSVNYDIVQSSAALVATLLELMSWLASLDSFSWFDKKDTTPR